MAIKIKTTLICDNCGWSRSYEATDLTDKSQLEIEDQIVADGWTFQEPEVCGVICDMCFGGNK